MRDKKNSKALLSNTKDFKEFREADIIISYLINPEAESKIPVALKTKLDRYILIHSLRMRYRRHTDIIRILKMYDRNERQARTDIAETEYIFGKVLRIDRDFEKSFLLEVSRQNIKIAMRSNDSAKISQAIKVHADVLGPETDLSDIPDFGSFEQHNYNVVLPPGVADLLKNLMAQGTVDLSKLLPSNTLQIAQKNGNKA